MIKKSLKNTALERPDTERCVSRDGRKLVSGQPIAIVTTKIQMKAE